MQAADEHNQKLKPKNLSPKKSGIFPYPFQCRNNRHPFLSSDQSQNNSPNHTKSLYRKALGLMLSNLQVPPLDAFSTRAAANQLHKDVFCFQVPPSQTILAESLHDKNKHAFLCKECSNMKKPNSISPGPKPDRNNSC